MSVWYLRRMFSVSLAVASSMTSMLRIISVRAQSSVSDTLGDFFRSSWRIERTMRGDLIGEAVADPGHLRQHDLLLPLELRVVDVEVQAAPLQRLGQLAGVVRREEHERDLRGRDRAEFGDRHLVVGEDLEQQRLGLDLHTVDLVDEEHDRVGGGDRLEQRTGQEELVGEDVVLDLGPVLALGRRARSGCAAAASCSSTRRGLWTRRDLRSTGGGSGATR